ncbi:hypothetical protein HMPREF1092_03296 [Clostridium thermobutyricum]|uniref:Resolvase HTH domain-containing protein n=1 Tax=Clostridium thermobutyricum TaxID=29372 RepID=N9XS31_9CLOT|nr:helix-turn-helix domain-containing protein [Clostridium thermobutyricum]ENY98738.1 hypothetical protein HMPREF1092_03296 [Clostridium thermobutyricum]
MIIDKEKYDNLLKELETYKCVVQALQFENDKIIKENKELKEQLNKKHKGGRKKKLTDMEIESIKMYRLQGISIRELSKIFNCSVGTIYNVIKGLEY